MNNCMRDNYTTNRTPHLAFSARGIESRETGKRVSFTQELKYSSLALIYRTKVPFVSFESVTPLFWQALEEYRELEVQGGLERQSSQLMAQEFEGSLEKYWERITDPAGLIAQYCRDHQPLRAWKTGAKEEVVQSVHRGMGHGNLAHLSWFFDTCYLVRRFGRCNRNTSPIMSTATISSRAKEYKSTPRRSASSPSCSGDSDNSDDGGSDQPEPPAPFVVPFPCNILSKTTNHAIVRGSQEGGRC